MNSIYFDHAGWCRECADRFRAMTDLELLISLADHTYPKNGRDGPCLISIGYMFDEMKHRGWDLSALSRGAGHHTNPCMLREKTLVLIDANFLRKISKSDREKKLSILKKYIIENYKTEKIQTTHKKFEIVGWLKKGLSKLQKLRSKNRTPSFLLACIKSTKEGHYDMVIVNHSNNGYGYVWFFSQFPYEEDDCNIGPIKANSIHTFATVKMGHIHSPYIFDFYPHIGAKPYTFMAEIPEDALSQRNRKYIKCLKQEGWILNHTYITESRFVLFRSWDNSLTYYLRMLIFIPVTIAVNYALYWLVGIGLGLLLVYLLSAKWYIAILSYVLLITVLKIFIYICSGMVILFINRLANIFPNKWVGIFIYSFFSIIIGVQMLLIGPVTFLRDIAWYEIFLIAIPIGWAYFSLLFRPLEFYFKTYKLERKSGKYQLDGHEF